MLTTKTFVMLKNISILNIIIFYSSKNPEINVAWFLQKYYAALVLLT